MGQLVARCQPGAHERGDSVLVPILVSDSTQPEASPIGSCVVVSRNATRDEIMHAIGLELRHMEAALSVNPPSEAVLAARQMAAEGTPLALPAGGG